MGRKAELSQNGHFNQLQILQPAALVGGLVIPNRFTGMGVRRPKIMWYLMDWTYDQKLEESKGYVHERRIGQAAECFLRRARNFGGAPRGWSYQAEDLETRIELGVVGLKQRVRSKITSRNLGWGWRKRCWGGLEGKRAKQNEMELMEKLMAVHIKEFATLRG